MKKYKNASVKKKLSGIQALEALQKGHMVRRSCWVKDFFIRICNETGYDKEGNILFNEKKTNLYTCATNGYLLHIGSSSQPFNFMHYSRDGEGLSMIFCNDWEDHGFISSLEFEELTLKVKEKVNKLEESNIDY